MTATPSWFDVIDATWPAARFERFGPWILREGRGGGSRVSAATAEAPVGAGDIGAAAAAMRAIGQMPLFMIRPGDAALDRQLARRGYAYVDPVAIHACPTAALADRPVPPATAFPVWEPLEVMREIWAAGGIGPARLAVMERTRGPRTGFLARHRDMPAGVAYAAVHSGVAMIHALEIAADHRRAGIGSWIMRAAAIWAAAQGAGRVAVMCTRANAAAGALYASLGMSVVGQYHYRHLPAETDPK